MNLRDPRRLGRVIDTVGPRVVINASSGAADWAVTADGPVRLAQMTARRGIRLVHVSSDAVLSGTLPPPPTSPSPPIRDLLRGGEGRCRDRGVSASP
ncbi:sugar nucleotide-binding protein [Streptomyces achromogenes]|uniref:sugar nucleotide-binding protein n=1 Tax=Streptomyces achromogenes TaxID=67255 RepID=UPI003A805BD5